MSFVHRLGIWCPRCISFGSSRLARNRVRPETTQLFDADHHAVVCVECFRVLFQSASETVIAKPPPTRS